MKMKKVLHLSTAVQATTFIMREWGDYKVEIHRLGDGCKCYGPCDKKCSLVVTYPGFPELKEKCVNLRVQWDDFLWNLEKGYYRLVFLRNDCDCCEQLIKIGHRCCPIGSSNITRISDCDSGVINSVPNTPIKCCPVVTKTKCDPCEDWPLEKNTCIRAEHPLPLYRWEKPCT